MAGESCRYTNPAWEVVFQKVFTDILRKTGAGSIGVAPWCSDRVSSLVEYRWRLNRVYGEGQQAFQVSKYVSLAELVDAPDLLYIVSW